MSNIDADRIKKLSQENKKLKEKVKDKNKQLELAKNVLDVLVDDQKFYHIHAMQ